MKWLNRILTRYGYWRWPERNGVRDTDAVARGQRWLSFYNEPGGLAEVLESMRRGYFEKAGQVKPGDLEALMALSLADRICGEIDGAFRQVITEGQLEANERIRADKIARLPEAMRRRL